MSPAKPRPRVALIIETSSFYARKLLIGINQYIKLHGPWSVFTERGTNEPDPSWLKKWDGDGILTRGLDPTNCLAAAARGVPVLSLRLSQGSPVFPTLYSDQELVCRRIVEHFLERGFHNFAYMGAANLQLSRERRRILTRVLKENGIREMHFRPVYEQSGLSWERQEKDMEAWLKTLPYPVAIMANFDLQGIQILDACRHGGIHVPDEVAVVGIDNDPVLCDLAAPPLSSLDLNVERIGFEAAATLAEMMKGKTMETKNYFYAPGEVVTRQSSDVIAVGDPQVVKAVQYIRENAFSGLDVNAVAKAAGMSRRSLEMKFSKEIGRTLLEEIQEVRLKRVRQLLLETDFTLAQIAEMAGFQYQEYLVRLFKKHTGMSPGQYRRTTRFGGARANV